MNYVRDYPSRLNDRESRRFETFSYLPEMDAARIRRQVEYALQQGWNCAIEHVEPERSGDSFWYMWKLPMFGERETDTVVGEINACRNANPGHHVRLIGYDNKRQTQGASLVVFRADTD